MIIVGLILSEWTDEPSPVVLEPFLLSHLLRSCVLSHCLEERVQKRVVILTRMHSLKTNVLNSRQRQHH